MKSPSSGQSIAIAVLALVAVLAIGSTTFLWYQYRDANHRLTHSLWHEATWLAHDLQLTAMELEAILDGDAQTAALFATATQKLGRITAENLGRLDRPRWREWAQVSLSLRAAFRDVREAENQWYRDEGDLSPDSLQRLRRTAAFLNLAADGVEPEWLGDARNPRFVLDEAAFAALSERGHEYRCEVDHCPLRQEAGTGASDPGGA